MNRRQFLQRMLAETAALTTPQPLTSRPPIHAPNRPNVLFIAVDDLNDWIGCLGEHPDAHTPNIDRLAGRGALFTQAYCPAPLCNPSRTAVLTGRHPSSTGIYHNDFQTQFFRLIPNLADLTTLPQYFARQGYEVMGIGKIFHNHDPLSWNAFIADHYVPGIDKTRQADQAPRHGIDAMPVAFDWGPLEVAESDMADARSTAWAAEKLRQDLSTPFFLGVGLFRPHLPWYLPAADFSRFSRDSVTLPDVKPDDLDDTPAPAITENADWYQLVLDYDVWPDAVAAYLASIRFMDARVGELLDALDASPHAENTIIVLWSDNGFHLGEKTYWSKDVLWEEALHIPMIIAAPGVTTPNSRVERSVSSIHLFPTLVDLCGLPAVDGLDGESLLPLLRDSTAAWNTPALSTRGYMNHSIRTERWRYTQYADGSEELYDHDADPLEWYNLAADSQYNDLKAELAHYLPVVNVPSVPKPNDLQND